MVAFCEACASVGVVFVISFSIIFFIARLPYYYAVLYKK